MADGLNMNGLSIHDSQHSGPVPNGFGRGAYVPPHQRSSGRPDHSGPPPMDNGAWGPPPG